MPDPSEIVRAPLWIHPTGEARRRLDDAIAWASAEAGGPRFQAHLTLAEGIELPRSEAELRLKQLAARVEPFEIQLEGIDWQDEYFRCLFARVKRTPQLEAARAVASEVFDLKPRRPFMPHVSLLYGEHPDARKERLSRKLEKLVGLRFTAESIHLAHCNSDLPVEQWGSLAERTLRPMAGVE